MFLFNAAVMGLGENGWMSVILEQFHNIVTNVANSYRLQEECDVLTLVLDKQPGQIQLSEFKAVMLASLRSLVPKEWDSDHEVAWNWLWENVERMIKANLGKPAQQEKALGRFIASLTQDDIYNLRRNIYQRFFQIAPAGQDHFKQSTTRLYFIADKIIEMTMEMYQQPRAMVEDISALGLRHVGYAIPTELFAPFVSSAVETVREKTSDDMAEGAFRWSLTLVSKILVRTILEGSTIVMKAINTNSARALRKAIAIAPRSKRATELLNITVGTQSISPFYWAIDSGSLECAKAMIEDLLTIRADRDKYYFGADELFARHPEVIQRLCISAPKLLWTLLDGLVWRSRQAFGGKRRVNFYV
ncbi:Pentatricopeptide repeat-containing protein, partial [Durusdinium trenchii]